MISVVLVGDPSPDVIAHGAIPTALGLVSRDAQASWLPTAEVNSTEAIRARKPDAIWCVPGSPYENMEGALLAIRYARENGIPFLGTCGGFQHAVIEYARNVRGIAAADHEESNPTATHPLIAKLSCALVQKSEEISLLEGTRLREIYNAPTAREAYQCSYGLNPELQSELGDGNFQFAAEGSDGAVRAFELRNHPFFIGTLFQPERSASSGVPHPLIEAFVRASGGRAI